MFLFSILVNSSYYVSGLVVFDLIIVLFLNFNENNQKHFEINEMTGIK